MGGPPCAKEIINNELIASTKTSDRFNSQGETSPDQAREAVTAMTQGAVDIRAVIDAVSGKRADQIRAAQALLSAARTAQQMNHEGLLSAADLDTLNATETACEAILSAINAAAAGSTRASSERTAVRSSGSSAT